MGRISWAWVCVGGVLAGIILNGLVLAAWATFLGPHWSTALESLGHSLDQGVVGTVLVVLAYFVEGIVAVWLYAAIRPRYGSGPGTALLSGVALWLLSALIPAISYGSLGVLPADMLAIDVLVFLVTMVIAAVVGCWFYDHQAPEHRPRMRL